MLVNNDLFEKEGLSVPKTYQELVDVCKAFRDKGYANPFAYSFVPIPMSDEGAVFLDMSNLQFSVNKYSSNLEMSNEFMRFLITQGELNEMAQNKGLMSSTVDLSFNSMYAAFGEVPEAKVLSPEEIGMTDDAVTQLRLAVFSVGRGDKTIDEAIAGYGSAE